MHRPESDVANANRPPPQFTRQVLHVGPQLQPPSLFTKFAALLDDVRACWITPGLADWVSATSDCPPPDPCTAAVSGVLGRLGARSYAAWSAAGTATPGRSSVNASIASIAPSRPSTKLWPGNICSIT